MLTALIVLGGAVPGCDDGGTGTTASQPSKVRITSGEPDGVRHLTTNSYVDGLAESLGHGYQESESTLRQAGFGGIIDDIKTMDGVQIYDIEAESLIREIAGRAEAAESGQGKKVLAAIYKAAADQYPAVAADDSFAELREIVQTTPKKQLAPDSFKFARTAAPAQTFSPGIEKAIRELGYVYADGHVSELSRIVATASGKANGSFSRHLAANDTAEAALRSYVDAHVPPPSPDEMMRTMMRESSRYPAVAERSSFIEAIATLDREILGFDPVEDTILRRYASVAESLDSRALQSTRASAVGSRGAISQASNAQNYVDYVSTALQPPTGGGTSARGGAGRGVGVGSTSYRISGPSSTYKARLGSIGARLGSRSFGMARFSAKAGRGVSAGASVTAPADVKVVNIVWVANPEDDRFGRFVVELEERNGGSTLVRTRTLFADSALAAIDALWGGHAGQTGYKKGDVLILMSMDPFAPLLKNEMDEAYGPYLAYQSALDEFNEMVDEYNELVEDGRARTSRTSESEAARIARQLSLKKAEIERIENTLSDEESEKKIERVETRNAEASSRGDRRLVVHPALYGRELAWSVARVDFWFNDLSMLSRETERLSGQALSIRDISSLLAGVETWQFVDRNASLEVVRAKSSLLPLLRVNSSGIAGRADSSSHIAVMMYDPPDDEDERNSRVAEFSRLNQAAGGSSIVELSDGSLLNEDGDVTLMTLTRKLQPIMNSLATRHHDFIRLNDFYESFAILRWAHEENQPPLIVDFDGSPGPIATPRRVNVGTGPFATDFGS